MQNVSKLKLVKQMPRQSLSYWWIIISMAAPFPLYSLQLYKQPYGEHTGTTCICVKQISKMFNCQWCPAVEFCLFYAPSNIL